MSELMINSGAFTDIVNSDVAHLYDNSGDIQKKQKHPKMIMEKKNTAQMKKAEVEILTVEDDNP
jgi:hypothetical protein